MQQEVMMLEMKLVRKPENRKQQNCMTGWRPKPAQKAEPWEKVQKQENEVKLCGRLHLSCFREQKATFGWRKTVFYFGYSTFFHISRFTTAGGMGEDTFKKKFSE